MGNVKAAMEYAAKIEREAVEKRLSETGSSGFKAPTLISVVAKHEQEIQELKRLITPMKKMIDAGIEMERKKIEWVGLTGVEINHILAANVGYPERMMKEVENLLKDKNT